MVENYKQKYEILIIDSIEAFLEIKDEWNYMLADNVNVCLTHEWISSWIDCFLNKDLKLCILIIKNKDGIRGIAPLVIKREKFLFLPISKIEFLSTSKYPDSPINLCPELDFIIKENHENIIQKIIEALSKYSWDILRFQPIYSESPSIIALEKCSKNYNYDILIKNAFESLVINTDITLDKYKTSLSKRLRKQLRYYENKFNELGKLEYVYLETKDDIKTYLPVVLDIEKRSWKWNRGVSINSIGYKNFFFHFPEKVSHFKWIHLWLLKLNNIFIAYDMNIKYNNTVINWKGSYDEKYSDYGPGQLLLQKELEFYISNGIKKFNMLWGSTLAKERWNPNKYLYKEVLIFRKNLYSRLLKLLLYKFKLFSLNRIFTSYKNRILRKLKIKSLKSELTRMDQINK